jgi:hypothetical protein
MWAVNEFSLKGVDFQKFCMSGAALCALGKECFLELAPDFVGDILWEHLEILQKGKCVQMGRGTGWSFSKSRRKAGPTVGCSCCCCLWVFSHGIDGMWGCVWLKARAQYMLAYFLLCLRSSYFIFFLNKIVLL